MLEKTWIVDAGGSWHGDKCSRCGLLIQQLDYVPFVPNMTTSPQSLRPADRSGETAQILIVKFTIKITPWRNSN
jgi:hypothetical protein